MTDKDLSTSRISDREKEIILLTAQGYTIKQIGHLLNISPTTVISHRKNLMNKLQCKNCPELIYRASQFGIL